MTYVAKVSLPGHDVKTATPEECAVTSEYPPLKAKIGQDPEHIGLLEVDFTAAVSQGTTHTLLTIPHGYGYTPLTLSNIEFFDGSQTIVGVGWAAVGATLSIKAEAGTSDFKVTINDSNNWTSSSARLKVSYYIFAEEGS